MRAMSVSNARTWLVRKINCTMFLSFAVVIASSFHTTPSHAQEGTWDRVARCRGVLPVGDFVYENHIIEGVRINSTLFRRQADGHTEFRLFLQFRIPLATASDGFIRSNASFNVDRVRNDNGIWHVQAWGYTSEGSYAEVDAVFYPGERAYCYGESFMIDGNLTRYDAAWATRSRGRSLYNSGE